MVETGFNTAKYVFEEIVDKGKRRPHKSFLSLPLLSHTLLSRTDVEGEMLTAVNMGKRLEKKFGPGTACSVFAGFALSDVPDARMSVIVYSDLENNDFCNQIAQRIWNHREGFIYISEPIVDSLRKICKDHRTLVCDHGDNMFSGGPASSSAILKELLEFGFDRFLVGPIYGKELIARLDAEDHTKKQWVEFRDSGLRLEVEICGQSDGEFLVTGPIYNNATIRMGRCLLLKPCSAPMSRIMLSSVPVEPFDEGVFRHIGIDSFELFNVLVLKSRMYCRPVFAKMVEDIVECDSRGITSSDYSLFDFKHLTRPIFPLDPKVHFTF